MNSKRADFNFVLIFAIIAGLAILLLLIYGAVKAGTSTQQQQSAELAKNIQSITDPLQSGFAAGKTSTISFAKETKIFSECVFSKDLGYNSIAVQSKSSVGKQWLDETIPVQIANKYIFASPQESKTFRVFSKPFEFPFKIADLLFISSENYCFIIDEGSEEIGKEILSLSPPNIGVDYDGNSTCKDDAIDVCFGYGGNCDITVTGQCDDCESEYEYGIVRKNSEDMFYTGSLLYGAIFSEKEQYDCNVQRLLFRVSKVSQILSSKTDLMNARGCNTNLKPLLDAFATLTESANPENLFQLYNSAQIIKEEKEGVRGGYGERCALW